MHEHACCFGIIGHGNRHVTGVLQACYRHVTGVLQVYNRHVRAKYIAGINTCNYALLI